jgi:hypothetical protein
VLQQSHNVYLDLGLSRGVGTPEGAERDQSLEKGARQWHPKLGPIFPGFIVEPMGKE